MYRRSPHVAWTRIDGETVVLNLESHWMFGLNETASRIWEALNEGAMGSALARLIAPKEEDLEKAIPLMTRFMNELLHEGLVERTMRLDENPPEDPPFPFSQPWDQPPPPGVRWKQKSVRQELCAQVAGDNPKCNAYPVT